MSMVRMKHTLAALILFLSISPLCFAQAPTPISVDEQSYVRMMQEPNANFYDIQRVFNDYWSRHERGKGDGWKAFKRWEYFWESRVLPDGSFPNGKELASALEAKTAQRLAARRAKGANKVLTAQANFTLMGPSTAIPTNGGCGRLTTVCFHPTNSNIMFVGTPAGGLWKSTNNGSTWTSNTDQFATLGVSCIAIDPQDPNVMYIGTGDRDASDSYGTGIYKSTDGGNSWSATGFSNTIQSFVIVSRIVVHPTQSNIIIAAASNGIYKSTNGGTTWTQKYSSNTKELLFMPTKPEYLYATNGGNILRSTNTGDTWTTLSPGFTASSVNRIALAVCAQNPRCVYALCSNASNSTFYGIYRSLDSGNTWSLRTSTPNILGGASDGSDTRGQGWYDLCVAVNQNDSNDVFVGGINTWRSTNGGVAWSCKSMWYTGTSLPYVHADEHEMAYKPNTTELYVCNDGGLFKTTNFGTTWTDVSASLQIMEFYRISHSSTSATKLLGGAQDNGSNFLNGSSWAQVYGGDGMDNAMDQSNDAVLYASSQNGNFGRSTNSGASFSTITPSGKGGTGAWVTPITLDASNYVYLAYTSVYKSTNQGTAWSTLGTTGLTSVATYLNVSNSNNSYIVVGNSSQLYRTTDAGTTWTNIKGTLPSSISRVIIHPQGPDTLIAVCSNWTSGTKVYKSTNGGTTWTNFSGSLPNVPVNCAIYEGNTINGLYIGTDIGVYYRNNSQSDWVSFDDGLPNVRVNDLEIFNSGLKLRAGTYGRGAWQANLYNEGPHAQMSVSRTLVCVNDTITFHDNSTNSPTSRLWLFPGGTPSSSTDANPVVSYSSASNYTVSLISMNSFGNDTLTNVNYITVKALPPTTVTVSKTVACSGDSIVLSGPPSMASYRWSTNDTTQSIVLKTIGSYQVQLSVVGANGCSATSGLSSYTIYASPTTTIFGDTLLCVNSTGTYRISATTPGSTYQWFKPVNGSFVGDSTGATVVIQWSAALRDSVRMRETNIRGCTVDRVLAVSVGPIPVVSVSGPQAICPNKLQNFSTTGLSPGTSIEWQKPRLGVIVGANNNPSGVNILFTSSGTDTVVAKVLNSFGCSSTGSLNLVVKIAPSPQVSGAAVVCSGVETTFSTQDNNGSNYSWSVPGFYSIKGDSTKNSITVKWTTGVRDSVRVVETASNGCSKESSVAILVETPPNPSISGVDAACVGSAATYVVAHNGSNTYAWSKPRLGTSGDTSGSSLNVVWTKSGVDTLLLTEKTGSGCSATTQYIVVVADRLKPAVATSSGTLYLCHGDKMTLNTSSGYSTYQWKRNGTTIGTNSQSLEISEDGYYIVNVSTGTCSGGSDTVHISFYDQPEKPTLSVQGNSLVCNEKAQSYEWYLDNVLIIGATTSSYTAKSTGTYCVRITDQNGCRSDLSCSNIVVGVDDLESASILRLEPNPADTYIRIHSTLSVRSLVRLSLVDERGRELFSNTLHSASDLNGYRIDLSSVAAGAYTFIADVDGSMVVVRKVVKR